MNITCPGCKSDKVALTSRRADGLCDYRCQNCNHTFQIKEKCNE